MSVPKTRALVGIVWLACSSPCLAGPFWGAIDELAETAGPSHLDGLMAWLERVRFHAELDPNAEAVAPEFGRKLINFDAAGLEELMPDQGKTENEKRLGLAGKSVDQRYVFTRVPPNDGSNAPIGGEIGDFTLDSSLSHATDHGYQLAIEGSWRVAAPLMIDGASRWLTVLGDSKPFADETIKTELARDFSQTSELLTRYGKIEQLVDGTKLHARMRLDMAALERDYPRIAKFFERSPGILVVSGQMIAVDEAVVASFAIDSRERTISIEIPDLPKYLAAATVQIRSTFETSVDGITIRLKGLKTLLTKSHDQLALVMRQQPEAIEVDGWAMGVFPVWFVDLLIPSNLQSIVTEFIGWMTSGIDGQGSRLAIADGKSFSRVMLRLPLYSNGLIRFATKMKGLIGLDDEDFLAEVARLREALLTAFASDFQTYRASK